MRTMRLFRRSERLVFIEWYLLSSSIMILFDGLEGRIRIVRVAKGNDWNYGSVCW